MVSLVPLSEQHAAAMLRWMQDPEVRQNVGVHREPSLEQTLSFIERTKDPSMAAFAILSEGVHVGNVVLDRIDSTLGTARLSIYIGETQNRGRGVGKRAVSQVVDHGFSVLGLYKIWLTVHAQNVRAIQSYISCGFRLEGILRGEFLLNGQRIDALYLGVTANDQRPTLPCRLV